MCWKSKMFRSNIRRSSFALLLACGLILAIKMWVFLVEETRSLKPIGRRVLGYACFKYGRCGGWADRQKGIVAAFVLSVLLDMEFKIYMPIPCHLDFLLSPRSVDWRLKPQELKGHTVQFLEKFGMENAWFARDVLRNHSEHEVFSSEYNFLMTNVEMVQLILKERTVDGVQKYKGMDTPEVYREVLTELFSFKPGLRILLNDFYQRLPKKIQLVCAQIRLGGKDDTETINRLEEVEHLFPFLSRYNDTSKYRIFISSDSLQIIPLVEANLPKDILVGIEGPVTHMDRYKENDACAGFTRAMVEQKILSSCHVLVISESGFGKIAAFIRNSDRELYLFQGGTVQIFHRSSHFPHRVW